MKKTKLEQNEAIITEPRKDLIDSPESIDSPKTYKSLNFFIIIKINNESF